MRVMSAGVHYVHFIALFIFGCDLAGIGQSGFFLNRQRVQISAHQHDRPVAIFHQADNAIAFLIGAFVFAHVLGHVAPDCF